LLVTSDASVFRRLKEQAWHPDMEAVACGEDAKACWWSVCSRECGETEGEKAAEESGACHGEA
jgi:hypothetical protein